MNSHCILNFVAVLVNSSHHRCSPRSPELTRLTVIAENGAAAIIGMAPPWLSTKPYLSLGSDSDPFPLFGGIDSEDFRVILKRILEPQSRLSLWPNRFICAQRARVTLKLPESILVLLGGRHHLSDVYVSRSDSGGLRADVPAYDNSGLSDVVHDKGSLD
ncbi:hypothetical protein PIB30_085214 [Stylosanthes scabra]|uniref:Uncharacterized protein n=1 Tax=Stylosanthes scabra TaxID=79078 RepID=A0ABU6XRT6_9FABA|nr:hypothetical protein [Stylosanthes scabra]